MEPLTRDTVVVGSEFLQGDDDVNDEILDVFGASVVHARPGAIYFPSHWALQHDRGLRVPSGTRLATTFLNPLGNHWVLLLFDIQSRTVMYMDSWAGDGYRESVMSLAREFVERLAFEDGTVLRAADVRTVRVATPHQPTDSNTCGFYAAAFLHGAIASQDMRPEELEARLASIENPHQTMLPIMNNEMIEALMRRVGEL